jgi:hypothetical protein
MTETRHYVMTEKNPEQGDLRLPGFAANVARAMGM